MKAKTFIANTLLLGLILVPAAVLAQGGPCGFGAGPDGGPGHQGFGFGTRLAQALDLTEEQQEQIRELREATFGEPSAMHEQMQQIHSELRELWTAREPDKQAILAKMAQMDELRQQTHEKMVDFRLAFLKILTPEQREQLQEMQQNRPQRAHRWGHKGRHGWRGGQNADDQAFGEW